jgi:hypothetical protein
MNGARPRLHFDGGNRLVEKYLTAWQRQSGGTWKIFRNMVIPDK